MKTSGATLGALALSTPAVAAGSGDEHENSDEDYQGDDDDAEEDYATGSIGAHAHLDDESTTIVAEVNWEPGGESGWHRHPGVVLAVFEERPDVADSEHAVDVFVQLL